MKLLNTRDLCSSGGSLFYCFRRRAEFVECFTLPLDVKHHGSFVIVIHTQIAQIPESGIDNSKRF